MFSILKKKYFDVFCYTNNRIAFEYFPIDYASNFIPRWWKDIPNNICSDDFGHNHKSKRMPTMKRCPGVIEYYKKGFMLPLWTDIEFVCQNNEVHTFFADHNTRYESHPDFEKGNFLSDGNWKHVKLISPWIISTSSNIGFNRMQPHWNLNYLNENVLIPNSYTDYFFNHAVNPQMFIHTVKNGVTNIDAGMPLAHLVPLTEKKMKLHILYDEEIVKYYNQVNRPSFIGSYYTLKKIYNKSKQ
jgi:hypothetical protein